MIPIKVEPLFPPGTRVRVAQRVRVGHRRWTTFVVGTVADAGNRPVGGMEMGGKALYCHQPTLRLTLDDGETTVVAIDENTKVEPIDLPTTQAIAAPAQTTGGAS